MSIQIAASGKQFKLETRNTSYVFCVDEGESLMHLYYGRKITDFEFCTDLHQPYNGASFCPMREGLPAHLSRSITMQEYTSNGMDDYKISSVAVRTADGLNCTDPRFVSACVYQGKPESQELPMCRINGDPSVETLEITLEDPYTKVSILLNYTVFPEQDVIVRSANVQNHSAGAVYVERLMSACVEFQGRDLDLIQAIGTYARERFAERIPLHSGLQEIFSKRSSSGHNQNPAFALASRDATEANGDVYGFALVYSGSFSVGIELDPYDRVRMVAGINPETFEWKLESGESFQTPELIMTLSGNGVGGMSRNLHDMMREHLISSRWSHAKRPILVNNWEATYFRFTGEKLYQIAEDAAKLGIEMLVLDDGWFGHRDNDHSSLGDWFVYQSKIGNLSDLVERINKLGVKFGLWFEPEMISKDSKLYESHPEWVLTTPGRACCVGRNQFVLNMADPAVVDYLFETISGVLKSTNIEYIKWDMNRQPTEKSWSALPPDRQKELGHRYVLGVYELHRRLLDAFPNLLIEGCSGGGGRFDAGLLYYTPQIWTSDNTDAIDRLSIQHGTSLFYPCSAMGAHVSVCPNHNTIRTTPFVTRGNVAMAGTFGYELDLNQLSEEDRVNVQQQTAEYHQVHHLVNDGDLYRLIPPGEWHCAWSFVSKDQKEALVCFVTVRRLVARGGLLVRLQGLNPHLRYRIEGTDQAYFGDTLMNAGLPIPFARIDGDSVCFHLTADAE